MIKLILILTTLTFLTACNRPIAKPISNKKRKPEINVPSACIDQTGRFNPVKSITTRLGYNEKAKKYQPISHAQGFISTDINHDRINDYLFIERNSGLIKLVSCMSQGKQYQRKQTPFIIHEDRNADFQTIFELIIFKKGLLLLSVNKHEHNWGSDGDIKTYRFSPKHNDFILIKQAVFSSSGDGTRSDTEAVYNLDSRRYQQKQNCGFAEEGCTSRHKTGRIILPKNRATLYNAGKVYDKLIAD